MTTYFSRYFQRRAASILLLLFTLGSLALASPAWAQTKRPSILYYNSATPEDTWWRTSSLLMKAACDDLGMDLKVVYLDRNPFTMVESFKALTSGPERPDAVVFQNLKQNAVDMLNLAEQARVPAFLFNAGLTAEQAAKYGGPREKFKYWIGQMLPDDQAAGLELALALYRGALEQGLVDAAGKVHMVGINGTTSDGAAIERSAGLALAVQKEPRIVLESVVSGHWDRSEAKNLYPLLKGRYAQARVFWAANDPMGLGIMDAMRESAVVPGKQMLVGSIDWTPEALQEVKEGRLLTSIGGHFMETAWVAVLLHDYLRGKDFASETVSFKSQMATLSKSRSAEYLKDFKPDNFAKINFRQFSKVAHPELKRYAFQFAPVLKEVAGK